MPSILAPAVRRVSAIAVICSSVFIAPTVMAQTAFTYQGQLKLSGSPYSGTADVRFTLYDASAGGSVVGAAVDVIGATIVDGVFTSELDFGALAFDGASRWLAIEVKTPSTGGAGPYSPLSPRQPVNPTPYAMHAAVAGLVPDTALTGAYSNALSMTNAGNVFAGDGSGLAGLDASNMTTGVLGGGQLGGTYGNAVSFSSAGNTFVGDGSGLVNIDWTNLTSVPSGFADGVDDVGVGTSQWTGTGPNSIYYLPSAASGVGVGTSTPDGRVHISGGPWWTSHFWYKSLTLDGAAAIEFGKNNAWKFGLGSTSNGLYLFRTTVDDTTQPAQYIMGIDSAGRTSFNMNGLTTNAPLAVAGGAGQWAFYSSSTGTDGFAMVGISNGLNGRGVEGQCAANGLGATIGVHGNGNYGILGTQNEGVVGIGVGGDHGVSGVATVGTASGGLYGRGDASNGNGLIAEANLGTSAYGVWGRAAQGIGGYFSGGTYAIVAAGKARVNTIEIVGGSDLAEPFDVAQFDDEGSMRDIEPGMVVVIDPANPGALKISTSANDRKVAGIISGANDLAPGMVMTSEGGEFVDGDHPVALTGRVWCWCDSATGAIEPGDMLTTSDTAGHAMKAVDLSAAQGAIIGKAMTPLAQGERGMVLVLVNLQ